MLPLPLAELHARAQHAKSALERHHNAFYLGEAAIKLAAAGRVSLWLTLDAAPTDRLWSTIAQLERASLGTWVGLLRVGQRALVASPLRDHPLVGGDHGVTEARQAFVALGIRHEVLPSELRKSVRRDPLHGFAAALVTYRNGVMGHGAQRLPAFYEELGAALLDAVVEFSASAALLGGLTLSLAGPALVGEGVEVRLSPLVITGTDEVLDRERLAFLNKVVRKVGVRRADYLDYATGETLTGDPAPVTSLLDRARQPNAEVNDVEQDGPSDKNVFGEYEVLSTLGAGAMGVVYRARQLGLDREVALKVLPPGLARDEVARARFRREVRALARADHPNVVKVLAAGERDGSPYYVMELVEGADLSALFDVLSPWMRTSAGCLSSGHLQAAVHATFDVASEVPAVPELPSRGLDVYHCLAALMADAADGVQHLHDHGVLHRDLKPANLMLTAAADRIVVMDLGLARLLDASNGLTTDNDRILGTLRYMPLEQLQRETAQVDQRADVYALGASLQEVVTGSPFLDGDSEQRLIHQVLHEGAPRARRVGPRVPAELDLILRKATEQDPEERYASAGELAADLRAFSRGEPISVEPLTPLQHLGRFLRKHRVPVLTSAALCLAALLAGLYTWDQTRLVTGYWRDVVDNGPEGMVAMGWLGHTPPHRG